MLRRQAPLLVLLASTLACGGGEASRDPEPRPATPVVTPEPEPTPPPPQGEHRIYQVFWREIHIATIYLGEGPLRSEERQDPILTGRSPYMSLVSHYYEQEDELLPIIQGAGSLDAFFARLAEDTDYRVEEDSVEDAY
jgi:hypothetical protein